MTYKEWSKEFVVDDTKTVQEYRSVERGETGDFETRCGGENIKISAERVTTYNTPVYVSKKATVKPKALHQINKNTEAAMRLYGIDIEKKPTIVITGDTELGNAAGLYDARSNTVYYAASLKREGLLAETGGEGATEYHEMWHLRQAEEFRESGWVITSENYGDYILALDRKCKSRLERTGINEYNIPKISEYAKKIGIIGRYDEVEAEYVSLNRGKRNEWVNF